MVPCKKSTAEEVLFEWSHHNITDSKVRTKLHGLGVTVGDYDCTVVGIFRVHTGVYRDAAEGLKL